MYNLKTEENDIASKILDDCKEILKQNFKPFLGSCAYFDQKTQVQGRFQSQILKRFLFFAYGKEYENISNEHIFEILVVSRFYGLYELLRQAALLGVKFRPIQILPV